MKLTAAAGSLFWLQVTSGAWIAPTTTSHSSYSTRLRDARTDLPDYGKTTVEVDTIKLEKPKPKSKSKSIGSTDKQKQKQKEWRRQDLFGSSIIDQTLEELATDQDFQETQQRLETIGLEGVSKEERTQQRRALTNLGIPPFAEFLGNELHGGDDDEKNPSNSNSNKPFTLTRSTAQVLQINIGLYCNQACGHCHVESSPLRTEMMTAETAAQCLELLKKSPSITTLDITGGAPELNANFRYLVSTARSLRPGLDIIDRCNLTVLQEPGQDDLVDFLKEQKVHIIASLPCYSEDNVDTQRGAGVFERSIAALLALNDAGYGRGNPDLELDLVYNPLGAFLPPPQDKLQTQYQDQLGDNFGIFFDQLFTITNMPIKRFADFLHRRGELEEYMELLVRNFNKDTVPKLMCMDTINVGWDGKVSYTRSIYSYYIYIRKSTSTSRHCLSVSFLTMFVLAFFLSDLRLRFQSTIGLFHRCR
jgi:radical SAM/Cys-rich protein